MKTQLTLQMLLDKYEASYSVIETIAYAETFKLPYPERVSKPKLPNHADSKQIREYADILEKYEAGSEKYEAEKRDYIEVDNHISGIIVDFIKQASGLNEIPVQYRDKVYSKAYCDGHSSGYYEVYQELIELVEIFN